MFSLKGFEDRHPAIREILDALSLDNLDHVERTALHFEQVAQQVASVLPDGPVLEELLRMIQGVQARTLDAIAATHALNEANGDPATAAPDSIPGRDHPVTQAPEPVDSIPGRDHPVTEQPSGFLAAPDADGVLHKVEPAQDAPAQAPQDAQEPATEPVSDSGPLGAVHATTEPTEVP